MRRPLKKLALGFPALAITLVSARASARALPSRAVLVSEARTDAYAIAFTRDGARVATVRDGRLTFLRGDSLGPLPALPGGTLVATHGFAQALATPSDVVIVGGVAFDGATGRQLILEAPSGPACEDAASAAHFTASGARASISCLGSDPEETTFVLDVATGRVIGGYHFHPGAGQPEGGHVTPSGNFVFFTDRGMGVFVSVQTTRYGADYGRSAVRSPHDRFIFTRPNEHAQWVMRPFAEAPPRLVAESGAVVYELPQWVETVAFSPSDNLFVARVSRVAPAAAPHEVEVYATSSARPVVRIPMPVVDVADVAFSPDESKLAILTTHGLVRLYALL